MRVRLEPEVVRDTDVGDDRELLITPGGGEITEVSGLKYVSTNIPASFDKLTWNGMDVPFSEVVSVVGPGKLTLGSGTLEIVGGAAARKTTIRVSRK